ncbi:uroporphyrinogen decarboxylase family protein [Cuniculiplasma sp. SKW3]|uniref:uroporphyrinogen decarboxylase family protein n=1 Tax=Cuniculiplasma sp. SKW3 TaxID=3400170 RepID=UPI003FD261FC
MPKNYQKAETLIGNNFLLALENEPHQSVPVWYMRQAGRFLREYRELREKVTINQICSDPATASKISYDAARILGVDAAIIFSDIVIPMENLGYSIEYVEGKGPVLSQTGDERSQYISKAARSIETYKKEHLDIPIIGFAGAPFTIFTYLFNNRGKDMDEARRDIYKRNQGSHAILEKISSLIQEDVKMQIESGADAIQIFDSWIGYLDPKFSEEIIRKYVSPIFRLIKKMNVKGIYFSTMTSGITDVLRKSEADFLSLDWRINLGNLTWMKEGLQGNLDPSLILYSPEEAIRSAKEIVNSMKSKNNYIFNLGHGILPGTDPNQVINLTKAVRSVKL